MIQWASYLRGCIQQIQQDRIERQRRILTLRFAPPHLARQEQERLAVAAMFTKPVPEGRKNVLRYEKCRRKMAMQWARIKDGRRLSYDQERRLDDMRNAHLTVMYGNYSNVLDDYIWLRDQLGVLCYRDALFIIAGRRSGKTEVGTKHISIYGLSQKNSYLYECNMTVEQAKIFMSKVMEDMLLLEKDDDFGFKLNRYVSGHYFCIIPNGTGIPSYLHVYGGGTNPSAIQNTRGGGNWAHLLFIDESGFFKDVAKTTVMPMVSNGAPVIETSSMPPFGGRIKAILEAAFSDGSRVYNVINQRRLCDECQAIEDKTETEVICNHYPPRPMHFRSAVAAERTEALMKPFGEDGFMQEMRSELARNKVKYLFDKDSLNAALGPEAIMVPGFHSDIPYIFTTVDPGSPQDKSKTAIVTVCFESIVPGLPNSTANAHQALPTDAMDHHCTVCCLVPSRITSQHSCTKHSTSLYPRPAQLARESSKAGTKACNSSAEGRRIPRSRMATWCGAQRNSRAACVCARRERTRARDHASHSLASADVSAGTGAAARANPSRTAGKRTSSSSGAAWTRLFLTPGGKTAEGTKEPRESRTCLSEPARKWTARKAWRTSTRALLASRVQRKRRRRKKSSPRGVAAPALLAGALLFIAVPNDLTLSCRSWRPRSSGSRTRKWSVPSSWSKSALFASAYRNAEMQRLSSLSSATWPGLPTFACRAWWRSSRGGSSSSGATRSMRASAVCP